MAGAAPSVDTLAESRELQSCLAGKLRDLPYDYRAPIAHRDIEGRSNQEVADALDMSLPAAKSHIRSARMQLREDVDGWRSRRDAIMPTDQS